MTSDAQQDRIPLAVAAGLITLAWYAMPDLVRSRPLRTVLKVGLLAGSFVAYRAFAPDDLTELAELRHELMDDQALVAVTGLGIGGVAAVLGEKAIFGFGERRRARGKGLAHTLPAAGMAVLAAAAGLIDPEFKELPEDLRA